VLVCAVAGGTGLAVAAALAGWLPLVDTEVLRLLAAVTLGAVGTIGTLAVADRERTRLHDLARRTGSAIRAD
jgi:hypothetical protein